MEVADVDASVFCAKDGEDWCHMEYESTFVDFVSDSDRSSSDEMDVSRKVDA